MTLKPAAELPQIPTAVASTTGGVAYSDSECGLPLMDAATGRLIVSAQQSTAFGNSVEAGGQSAAPGAGATLATLTIPQAGTWEIDVLLSVIGDVGDNGNCDLKKNAAVLCVLAGGRSPTFRKVCAQNDTFSVVTVNQGTVGSEYAATLVARQVA